jgi:hypothetical protein
VRFNIIRNNNVNRTGGASTGGGGIRLGDGRPRILNNIIIDNAGMYGGGIVSNYATPLIANNIVARNMVSQAIVGTPTYGGGGLWFNGNVPPPLVHNNTVVGNSATGSGGSGTGGRGGGLIAVFGSTINTRNNIVWGNTQTTGGQVAAVSATAFVSYSDVEGGFTGVGNVNLPPLFADTSFHLQQSSPCIDAGDTSESFLDPPDPSNPGLARWPALAARRNDMGVYGGPWSYLIADILTPVDEVQNGDMPADVRLLQNYPNPFNPSTTIRFSIPVGVQHAEPIQRVQLKVYDVLGREVAVLLDANVRSGDHTLVWDASGNPSGIYMYNLTAGEYSATKKMIIMK